MIKFGQVTEYNEKTHKATITYIRPDACAKCGACGSMNKSGSIELKADCKEGDWVRVVLPDDRFLSAAALAYVVPMVAFFVGLLAAYFLSGKNELWALAGSLTGVLLSLGLLRIADKKIAGNPSWTPCVDRVYTEKPEIDDIGCDGAQ